MNNTIIYAHPWNESFNSAILNQAIESIKKRGENYKVIDLYKDQFNPVMSNEELRVYSKGGFKDPLIKSYNDILDDTDRVIVIFPIWWYDMPAIMRGFFDKVMLSGSAYNEDHEGMHALRSIDDTIVLTTSSAPTDALINDFNNPIVRTIIDTTFKCIGFNNGSWHNLGTIAATSQDERKEHLANIEKYIYNE